MDKELQLSKASIRAVVLATVILTSQHAFADEIVAILDLKFIKNTGKPAAYICDEDDECDAWALFYLYEATVDKVLSGEL